MQVISYLGFTLLSVVIQFAVIGLIQSKEKLTIKNKTIDLNMTSPKQRFHDLLKDLDEKPHALFYRTKMNAYIDKNKISTNITTNSSLTDISLKTTTELTSTIVDIFYDENISSSTFGDSFTSTESLFTTTEMEFDNVTDITFFEKKNETVSKPKVTPITPMKKNVKDCDCNLLYNVCDINCCCDSDCKENQMKMFSCFGGHEKKNEEVFCDVQHTLTSYLIGSSANNLFCVVKNNLPEKRIANTNLNKHDPSTVNKSLKWHASTKERTVKTFEKHSYSYGDPIWVLRNGSVFYIDLPTMVTNNYCTERKPIKFLHDEKITCNVKLTDLETFQILGARENASVISVTEKSLNSSVLNCTTFHCANWTVQVCGGRDCVTYDKDAHEPLCTDKLCTQVALRVDYLFHYYDSKIMNVTIRLHTQNISISNTPFFAQEVNVIFLLTNESLDQVISLSGNPGYVSGLPIIISHTDGNYSYHFYNKTEKIIRHLNYPENDQGMCVKKNFDNTYILFEVNKRIKCRYVHVHNNALKNATDICRNIQNNLALLLNFKSKINVSPLGNPLGLKDSDWLPMSYTFDEEKLIYGEINNQKLLCYNMIARVSFVFTYNDVSEVVGKRENKILSAKIEATEKKVTLNVEDMSLLATVDIMFIDESKPTVYDYAAAPQFNIHLPRDFFFPFPNSSTISKCNVCVILCAFLLLLITK